ncbi:MAG TPA: hypothetical protein VD948_07335 [Rhodothermales bacterium]|nr:hypothetical protein [Rhodothermales bacterium]
MSAWLAAWAMSLLLLALGSPVLAQTARVRIEAESVRVGARFRLVLRVETESGMPVAPRPGPVGDLELVRELGRGAHVGAPLAPGVRVDSFVYEAAAFALDSLIVPPLRVALVEGRDTQFVATAPVTVPVRRLVPDSTATLQPPRPLDSFGQPWWRYAALTALIAGLTYFAVQAWRRRLRTPMPVALPTLPVSARRRYVQTLDALAQRLPATVPEARAFFVDLADAVRRYAEEQAGVHAREMTSTALVRALERLERNKRVALGTSAEARRLLDVADLGRYASTCPPPQETRAALDAARTLAAALDVPVRTQTARAAVPTDGSRVADR